MKPHFVPGNRVDLLETGAAYFPALLAAIDAATSEIHLHTYIFENDATGRAVGAALMRAAARGVKARLLVDGFGSRDFANHLGRELLGAGVEVLIYRPETGRLRLRRHRLRRQHGKVAVIDGNIAFVGGINIIDDWDAGDTPARVPARHDYAVRVEGPLLGPIHQATRHVWQVVCLANLHQRYLEPPLRPTDETPRGDIDAAFVIRDNLRHRRDIEKAYLEAIHGARREILLASAYFLPGRRFRHALAAAARRGVTVTVLLQGRVEYRLQHYATQALYGSLFADGIRIFEFQPSFLHAKVAVIDGLWSTVGSSNIDPFSLLLAREANIVVRDAGFAATLQASLRQAIASNAREVRRDEWQRVAFPARIARWLAYGLVRLLVGVTGYGRKDYSV